MHMPCVLQAALPLRRSTYEERWQQLEAWPAGKPITFQDVPWPCPTPGSQAAAARKQPQQEALQLDPKHLQTLVLAGEHVLCLGCLHRFVPNRVHQFTLDCCAVGS